jgi:hypothetical protein
VFEWLKEIKEGGAGLNFPLPVGRDLVEKMVTMK